MLPPPPAPPSRVSGLYWFQTSISHYRSATFNRLLSSWGKCTSTVDGVLLKYPAHTCVQMLGTAMPPHAHVRPQNTLRCKAGNGMGSLSTSLRYVIACAPVLEHDFPFRKHSRSARELHKRRKCEYPFLSIRSLYIIVTFLKQNVARYAKKALRFTLECDLFATRYFLQKKHVHAAQRLCAP